MRVRLTLDDWRTVTGGGVAIDLLIRKLSQLEQIRLGEMLGSASSVTDEKETFKGSARTITRTITTTPRPGRYAEGIGEAMRLCVRGWRGVEDEAGTPIPFSEDALNSVTANYPEWAEAMMAVVRECAGLVTAEKEPDPQKAS